MVVKFCNTTKRVNSMAIPDASLFNTYECQLKERCAITAPFITLSEFVPYNYCYIPQFNRYYFVTSTTIESSGIYTYSLAVDVLASFKAQILNQVTYIKRSASNYNLMLPDDTWLHTSTPIEYVHTATNSALSTSDGTYIVTVVNKSTASSANPASTMYAMGEGSIALFLSHMFDLDNYSGVTDLEATYFNPFQYVTSCKWLPIHYNNISGVDDHPSYGWYEADENVYCKRITEYGKTLTWSITVPGATDWTWKDGNWTRHLLYIPFCGEIEIDPVYSGKTLNITQYVDYNTGTCNAVVTTGTNKIVSTITGTIGANVSISQVAGEIELPTNKVEAVKMVAEVAGGAVAKGGKSFLQFGKSVLEAMGASYALGWGQTSPQEYIENRPQVDLDAGKECASSIKESLMNSLLNPTVTTSGSDGARYTITHRHNVVLYTRHFDRYVDATSYTGGMCHQVHKLGDLSGYTQVANGMFLINTALDEEKSAIRQITETGFYIE